MKGRKGEEFFFFFKEIGDNTNPVNKDLGK